MLLLTMLVLLLVLLLALLLVLTYASRRRSTNSLSAGRCRSNKGCRKEIRLCEDCGADVSSEEQQVRRLLQDPCCAFLK